MANALSMLSVLIAVAAIGTAIVGLYLLMPISGFSPAREWHGPIILTVLGGTMAASWALFRLSDYIAWRLIGTPDSQHVEEKWRSCMYCNAPLKPYDVVCRDCGALVPAPTHARSSHVAHWMRKREGSASPDYSRVDVR